MSYSINRITPSCATCIYWRGPRYVCMINKDEVLVEWEPDNPHSIGKCYVTGEFGNHTTANMSCSLWNGV